MKFSILALGAAVAGITTQCAAQIQIESAVPARNTQTRLVSQNQDFFGSSGQVSENNNTDDNATYYAESTADTNGNEQPELPSGSRSVLEKTIAEDSPAIGKPVTTNAPLHVLTNTPEVGMVPVNWQGIGCQAPNPTATYLLQTWCTDGLWATYPCQRAAQCARIQQHIHGYNRYTGSCATCAPAGQAFSCASGNCGAPVTACAKNTTQSDSVTSPVSSLATTTPAPTSLFVGELQAGLPVVDVPQLPPSQVQMTAYGQQPPVAVLPSGQPLLQLPTDVPTVPANVFPTRAAPKPAPGVQPSSPGVLPSMPLPTTTPVVASRQTSTLR